MPLIATLLTVAANEESVAYQVGRVFGYVLIFGLIALVIAKLAGWGRGPKCPFCKAKIAGSEEHCQGCGRAIAGAG